MNLVLLRSFSTVEEPGFKHAKDLEALDLKCSDQVDTQMIAGFL